MAAIEIGMANVLSAEANRLAAKLANIHYEGGVTSYLEVLFSEQELFDAELALSHAQANELLSVIQLYRALGGGWQVPADSPSTDPEPSYSAANP